MKRLSYIAPETEVITAYAQELMDAVNDGNGSGGLKTQGVDDAETYEYDMFNNKSAGGDEAIVDSKNMWGNLWED